MVHKIKIIPNFTFHFVPVLSVPTLPFLPGNRLFNLFLSKVILPNINKFECAFLCLPTTTFTQMVLLFWTLGFSLYSVSWNISTSKYWERPPSFVEPLRTCHNLLIHSTINAHLGSFRTSTTTNDAAINNLIMGYFIHI